jgi:hypothetical protein
MCRVFCALLLLLPAAPAQALSVKRRGPASWGITRTLARALRKVDVDDLRLVVRTRRTRRRIRVVVRVIGNAGKVRVRIRTSVSRRRRARWRTTRRLARRVAARVRAATAGARDAARETRTTDTIVASRELAPPREPEPVAVAPAPRPQVQKKVAPLPPRLPVVELGVGVGYASHSFRFETSSSKLSVRHDTGAFAELVTELSFFPLRAVDRSPIAGLGVRLTYARALGLETSFTDAAGKPQTLETDASRGWGGFVFALPRLASRFAPRLELQTGFSFVAFMLETNEAAPPHVELYVGGGATIVQPLARWLELHLGGEYRAIIAAATLMDRYTVGVRSVQQGLVRGGLQGAIVAGLGYSLALDYEPFTGEVPAKEGDDTLSADGHRLGLSLALRYGF